MVSERTSFIALWVLVGLSGAGAVWQYWTTEPRKPPQHEELDKKAKAQPRPAR